MVVIVLQLLIPAFCCSGPGAIQRPSSAAFARQPACRHVSMQADAITIRAEIASAFLSGNAEFLSGSADKVAAQQYDGPCRNNNGDCEVTGHVIHGPPPLFRFDALGNARSAALGDRHGPYPLLLSSVLRHEYPKSSALPSGVKAGVGCRRWWPPGCGWLCLGSRHLPRCLY